MTTVSQHVYAATLIGAPDRLLSIRENGTNEVQFDPLAVPYVTSSLEVAIPSLAVLTELDPRANKRVRITANAIFPWGTQARTFDLALRDRSVNHLDGTVTLYLASDESVVADWTPLANDEALYTRQGSLRSIVAYVLQKVIPGATLAAGPDVAVPVYASGTNEMNNPSAALGTTGWNATNLNTFTRATEQAWTDNLNKTAFNLRGTANTDSYIDTAFAASGMAGRTYLLRGRQRNTNVALPSANAGRLRAFYSTNGGATYWPLADAYGTAAANSTADVSMRIGFPIGTTHIIVRAYHGFNNDQSVLWSDFRLSEYTGDPTDVGYYDGNTPDTDAYLYDWADVAGLSVTRRRALISRDPEALLWKAGQSGMAVLVPLVQSLGLRLLCDETRTWTLRAEDYSAPGGIAIRHAVNLVDATDSISRDSETWFDAAVTVYRWTDRNGDTQERRDVFALANYTRVRTFERNVPYPGPGFSEYAVRRAQGRGREVTATTIADWTATGDQPVSIVIEGAPTQVGKTGRVRFSLTRDEVTVTARTTDTPLGAIDLLLGTIDQLVGTIDSL